MEPISTTMIATLILSKAAEEGGKKLGEAVSNKIEQLLNLIRGKFKAEGVEGKLTKAQEEPSDKNQGRFEQELAIQMQDDNDFANKLRSLVEELKSSEQVKQVFLKDVKAKQDIKVGNIEQEAKEARSVMQEAATSVEADGSITIGDVKQRG